jgi:aspartyl-tRNA(Asn)/glutamyl-tRNA(Gln) amidotransferase subunit C
MYFNKDKIKSAARMVRIRMTDKQAEEIIPQMEEIIKWMGGLDEVNADGVKPLISTLDFQLPLRKDIVRKNGEMEDILAEAPDRCGDSFAVPKVVE